MKQKKSIYLGNNSLHEVTLPRYKEYDDKNPESIYTHSKKLINKSIRELYPSLIRKAQEGNGLNQKNTGLLGNMVELYHYGKVPDNIDRPDFPDAGKHGCELKCTGIKVGAPEAKELLRITKININNVTIIFDKTFKAGRTMPPILRLISFNMFLLNSEVF